MKKALAIGLAAVMAVSMSAPVFAEDEDEGKGIAKEDLKVGVIYIGDENEGYTAAHMKGIDEMEEKLGLDDSQIIEKTLIGEDAMMRQQTLQIRDVRSSLQTALDMRLIYWKQQGNIRRFSSVMQQEHRLHPADFPICITILQIFMKHVTCQV